MSREQFDFIVAESLESVKKKVEIERDAWIKGNDHDLAKILLKHYNKYDYSDLNRSNNRLMELIVSETEKNKKIFVIASTEQMVLEDSLPNRLTKQGYKVERVK